MAFPTSVNGQITDFVPQDDEAPGEESVNMDPESATEEPPEFGVDENPAE